MNKDELLKKFEENVAYLKRNIPPDDIYVFAEQTFMAAMYFISKWGEWVELRDEANNDPVSRKWLVNILALQYMRKNGEDCTLDFKLDELLGDDCES